MTSVDRTFQIGTRAFDLMRTYCLTAAPRSYELWYTVVTGLKPSLNRSVDRIVAGHTRLTDGDVESLFEAHFASDRLIAEAGRTGGEIVGEVDQVNELIDLALTTSERYGRSLDAAVEESTGADRERLATMLRSLLGATREVSETNRTLASRFRRSGEEIRRLRDELARVQQEALTDPLTGIANRRMFDQTLHDAREAALASGSPLSLLFIDIDSFKAFNDRFGHSTGDQVLRLVAGCMRDCADTVARLGGEEFALLAPEGAGLSPIAVLDAVRAERMPFDVTVTVSLGSCIAPLATELDWKALYRRADIALFAAKDAGRDRARDAALIAA